MERRPVTHRANVDRAMATLDHIEMVALSNMFERWAPTEERITPDHRTMLIELCADYGRIAEFCGEGWMAPEPENPPDAIAFMARAEARAQVESYFFPEGDASE
jgi:hypothetical protein